MELPWGDAMELQDDYARDVPARASRLTERSDSYAGPARPLLAAPAHTRASPSASSA